jgi:hypothetical protein
MRITFFTAGLVNTLSVMGDGPTPRRTRKMRQIAHSSGTTTRIPRILALSALLMCVICPRAFAASLTLNWSQNTEPYLAGYKVHYGLAPRSYQSHLDVGKTLSRAVTGLADGKTYYFAVTAYDSLGNESVFSQEVTMATSGVSGETITAPLAPGGPTTGATGVAYTYTTGGSVSSAGDPVQYRFSWSDGSVSDWLPAASAFASKAWGSPGTYTLVRAQARCALHSAIVSAASPSIAVVISAGAADMVAAADEAPIGPGNDLPQAAYVLWTRSDTGQAVLSEVAADPASGTVSVAGSAYLHSPAGAGEHWRAVSYSPVDAAAGYVLWTHDDTGKAELWQVDPSAAGTIPILNSAALSSPSGDGSWEAAGYAHVNASTGYVLWTRGDTGQAELWEVDPGAAGTVEVISTAQLQAPGGGPWKAARFTRVDASSGYVLWTRGDTGQAELWKVDTSVAGTIPVVSTAALTSPPGTDGTWQATDYTHVDESSGYVLWTRGDTGEAGLMKIDPGAAGTIPAIDWVNLTPSSGMGEPWLAADYAW